MFCFARAGETFIGISHNHTPAANGDRRCFFWMPGTKVATTDLLAFRAQRLVVSIIVCGDSLTYIGADEQERRVPLSAP